MGAKVATFEQCYNAEKRRRLLSSGADLGLKWPEKRSISVQFGQKRQKNGVYPFTCKAWRAEASGIDLKTEHVRSLHKKQMPENQLRAT